MSRRSWKQEWIDEAGRDRWFVAAIVNLPLLVILYGVAAAAAWLRRRLERRAPR